MYSIHHFEELGKMDPICRKGKLVDFEDEMISYWIWDPESGKMVKSSNASCDTNTCDVGKYSQRIPRPKKITILRRKAPKICI